MEAGNRFHNRLHIPELMSVSRNKSLMASCDRTDGDSSTNQILTCSGCLSIMCSGEMVSSSSAGGMVGMGLAPSSPPSSLPSSDTDANVGACWTSLGGSIVDVSVDVKVSFNKEKRSTILFRVFL